MKGKFSVSWVLILYIAIFQGQPRLALGHEKDGSPPGGHRARCKGWRCLANPSWGIASIRSLKAQNAYRHARVYPVAS